MSNMRINNIFNVIVNVNEKFLLVKKIYNLYILNYLKKFTSLLLKKLVMFYEFFNNNFYFSLIKINFLII